MIKKYYNPIRVFIACGVLAMALNACGPFFGSNDDGGTDIAGTINVFGGSAVDSDVNDPNSPYQPNDSLQNAQPVTNPVTLGGYVNQPQAGPAGRSFELGDPDDYFSVALLQNQQITLDMGNRNNTNAVLDFYLYDVSDLSVVDSHQDVTASHTFTVPAKGNYIIQVHAAAGAANYNLIIAIDGTAQAASSIGATVKRSAVANDFIPGEVIVRFKDNAAAANRQQPAAVSVAGSLGLDRKGGAAGREMLFHIADRQSTLQALGIQRSVAATDDVWQQKQDTLAVIKALRQRPDVAYAVPNYIVRPALVPNDTYFPKQWHYNLINLPQAWDVTTGDPNVIVAVVDTGVLPNHPDLQDKLVPGYDFVVNRNGQNIELDSDPGIDADPTDPGGGVTGSSFHGTHVTGTVAAATNNSAGVAGVGWNVKVMPLRALGANEGSLYDVGQAVRYAAGLPNDSPITLEQPVDIINLSLGAVLAPADVDKLREPFDLARQAGVIVIAAAGNDHNTENFFPASLDSVISVNAVDMNKQLASYSNFGPTIDLSAPGGDSGDINGDGLFDGVYSLGADDSGTSLVYGYTLAAGTSMAAPHVSGVAALMKSAFLPENLTPDDFDRFLKTGSITEDLGDPGRDDTFGYGLIDARKAVVAAASGAVPPLDPIAIVAPASISLTPERTAVDINVRNGGDGTLTVNNISNDSGGWLQVTPVNIDNEGLGDYHIAIDNNNVPPDTTTLAAVITITTTVNTLQVPVIAQLQVIPFANNAGTQYVLLLDENFKRQYGIEAQVSDGYYRFRFNNVAKGSYYLMTGSDINNDTQICDPGESCGQYPTLDHPRMIEITSDSTYFVTGNSSASGTVNATPSANGLEFETGYHVTISSQGAAGVQRTAVNR